jgi:phytoene dehydrogenase-like protein
MRAAVVGAGLGGLLSALGLLKKGYDVTVFETLGYPGGRFTNREYRGYQLSTGALHMIPHGRRGPLGRMLSSLGADVDIIDSVPDGLFRVKGRDYPFDEISELFSLVDKVKLSAVLAKLLTLGGGGEDSFKDWLQRRIENPLALKLADSFCGWALSIDSSQISAKELIAITKNVNRLKGPGIPLGGCKGVTDALVEGIESEGGKLELGCRVKKIGIKKGKAKYVATNKDKYDCNLVVSDVGPKATVKLVGEVFPGYYAEKINGIKEAVGIKISVACDKPMLGHSGVLFTPEARRIDGLNEVTNADPRLAPKGKHLLMAHQALVPEEGVREEIRMGIADLHKIFPDFKEHCRVITAQCYRGKWPVNRALSGMEIRPETPVKNLYIVGDAVKPNGYMETDGLAAGVELAMKAVEGD